MDKKNINSVRVIMLGLIFVNLISLLSDMILSYKFGADTFTDAFFIAQSVPFVLYLAIAIAATSCLVSIYKSLQENKLMNDFTSNILNISLMIALVVIVIVYFFAKPIVEIFAVGFDEEALTIAVKLTRIIIFSLIPISIISILKGFLQYKRSFFTIAFESVPIYIGLLLGILLSSTEQYNILGFFILIGYSMTAVIMLFSAYKNGLKYKPVLKLKEDNIKFLMILALPIFVNLFSYQISNFIDRTLASTVESGAVSSLFYSQKLLMIVVGVLFFMISSVVFPMLLKSYKQTEMKSFKEILFYSLNSITVIILPMSIFLITFANPVITVLFERGAFNAENTKLTADVFMMYAAGILPMALKLLLDNIFYAMKDKKTPLFTALIFVIVNIILDYVLIGPLQTMGIALSTSIASIVAVVVMLFVLRQKIGRYSLLTVGTNILKIILAGIPISLGTLILFTMTYYSMKNSLANIVLCLVIIGVIFRLCYKILLKILNIAGLNDNKLYKEEIKAAFFKRYKRKYKKEDFNYQPVSIPLVGYENYFEMSYDIHLVSAESNEEQSHDSNAENDIDRIFSDDLSNVENAEELKIKYSRAKKSILKQYKMPKYRLKKYNSKNETKNLKNDNKLNNNNNEKSNTIKLKNVQNISVYLAKNYKKLKRKLNKRTNKIFNKQLKQKVDKFLALPVDDKFDNEI